MQLVTAGLLAAISLTAIALGTGPSHAQAPGWCMSGAHLNPTEQAICRNTGLMALDNELNELYRNYMSLLREYRRDATWLKAEQKSWLTVRNSCGYDEPCIFQHYTDRVAVLRAGYRSVN